MGDRYSRLGDRGRREKERVDIGGRNVIKGEEKGGERKVELIEEREEE